MKKRRANGPKNLKACKCLESKKEMQKRNKENERK
jgi:hypothetical protein